MAKGAANPFQINHEMIVRPPAREEAIPVPLLEWRRLMQRISSSGEKTPKYEAMAWASIGISVSCLLSAITFPLSISFTVVNGTSNTANLPAIFTEVICVIACIGSGVLAWWAFDFAKQHSTDRAEVRNSILADMSLIEERHPPKLIQPTEITSNAT